MEMRSWRKKKKIQRKLLSLANGNLYCGFIANKKKVLKWREKKIYCFSLGFAGNLMWFLIESENQA